MPAFNILINALDSAECNPKQFGTSWRATCPGHTSANGTLKLTELKDGGVVFHCFAGCEMTEVLESLGLTWKILLHDDNKPFVPSARPKKVSRPVATWRSPVAQAQKIDPRLKPDGNGVWVGKCSCGASLIAGSYGVDCLNGCPADLVGQMLRDLEDVAQIKGVVSLLKKKITILGCIEKKRGISAKTGNPWTLYTVHANDENGQPITEELTSFNELPVGTGEYTVERRESQYGVQFTVNKPSPMMEAVFGLTSRIEAIEKQLGIIDTPPVVSPPVAPVVVESQEVPF